MIGKKWSDSKLLRLATAYEKMIEEWRASLDKPMFMPATELRDIVEKRSEKERMVLDSVL
jgi:Asp-tRNA(Asn)/Glu-tRNA(Gln) amidotransferase A subunit family amidase